MKTTILLTALWRALQAALCACLLYAFSQAFVGTTRKMPSPEEGKIPALSLNNGETGNLAKEKINLVPLESAPRQGQAQQENIWRHPCPGLEYATFVCDDGRTLHVTRINPQECEFVLCAATREGGKPRTLGEWAQEKNLDAVINASMYLPDGKTSTGFMRDGSYVNNPRMGRSYGGFFIAKPDNPSLPRARIIDRGEARWKETLSAYALVLQSYRILGEGGKLVWKNKGKPTSIAAIGQDKKGSLLFVFCQDRTLPETLAAALAALPLEIERLLYAEGGAQAGLFVKTPGKHQEMSGKSTLGDFVPGGSFSARIPNALGVRGKQSGDAPLKKEAAGGK